LMWVNGAPDAHDGGSTLAMLARRRGETLG